MDPENIGPPMERTVLTPHTLQRNAFSFTDSNTLASSTNLRGRFYSIAQSEKRNSYNLTKGAVAL
jgi:hypothetical protein